MKVEVEVGFNVRLGFFLSNFTYFIFIHIKTEPKNTNNFNVESVVKGKKLVGTLFKNTYIRSGYANFLYLKINIFFLYFVDLKTL